MWSRLSTLVDFVGNNRIEANPDDAHWAGVINWDETDSDYVVEFDRSHPLGGATDPPRLDASDTLHAGEVLNVYEVSLDAGEQYEFTLEKCGGADAGLFLFTESQGYFKRQDAVLSVYTGDAGSIAQGEYWAAESGYHGIVVCKDENDDLDRRTIYNLIWGRGPLPDLCHDQYSDDWSDILVARSSYEEPVGQVPDVLDGDLMLVDCGYLNSGIGVFPAAGAIAFTLDGDTMHIAAIDSEMDPGSRLMIANRQLSSARSGRHELGSHIDAHEEVLEIHDVGICNYSGNVLYERYTWLPGTLADRTPLLRDPAPNYRDMNNPVHFPDDEVIQDGYRGESAFWTAVAVTPHAEADQLNLYSYNYASDDPRTGLTNWWTSSRPAAGHTAVCAINGHVAGAGESRDFGVANNLPGPDNPSQDGYTIELAQREAVLSEGESCGPYEMTSGSIVRIFEVELAATAAYTVELEQLSGSADLGLAVFATDWGYFALEQALLDLNSNGAVEDESGELIAEAEGPHGVLVYKTGSADVDADAEFRIALMGRIPEEPDGLIAQPLDFSFGHATVRAEWLPVTADINGRPLAVDYYNVYYSDSPSMEDPIYACSTTETQVDLEFHQYGLYDRAFFHVVAVVDPSGRPAAQRGLEASGGSFLKH